MNWTKKQARQQDYKKYLQSLLAGGKADGANARPLYLPRLR